MVIKITRDSVCAGDDCDAPHELRLDLDEDASMLDLAALLRGKYLPTIAGGRASWCLSASKPLVVISQQSTMSIVLDQFLRLVRDVPSSRVHVSYFAQEEPETVARILRRLQLVEHGTSSPR